MRIYKIEKDVEKLFNLTKKILNSKNIFRSFFIKKNDNEKYYKTIKKKILNSIYFINNSPTIIIGEVFPSYDDENNIIYIGKSILDIKEENDISLFCQIYHELCHSLDKYFFPKYYKEYETLPDDYKYFSKLELHAFIHEFYAMKYLLKGKLKKIDSLEKMKKINYAITSTLYFLYNTNPLLYKKYYLLNLFYHLKKNKIKLNKRLQYQIINIEKYINQIYLE